LFFFKNAKEYIRAGNDDPTVPPWDREMEQGWQSNWRNYWNHLDEIADRLGPKAYDFFRFCNNDEGLHDGYLLSLNFGDCIALDEAKYSRLCFTSSPSSVALTILNYEKTTVYSFLFKAPRRVAVNVPGDDRDYFEEGKTLGQIMMYEIRAISPKYLAVEWLLDSEGTILIEFEKLGFRSKSLRSPQRKR
jgi:hypothetical protein